AATFLAQLFFDEIYSDYIGVQIRVDTAEEYRGWTTEDLLTIWRGRRYTKSLNEVVYILGGFDHCDGESARRLLRWLEFIATQTDNPIKIIITSTTGLDGHVKEALSSCPDGAYRVFDLSAGAISDSGGSSGTDSHLAFLLQQQPRYDAVERKLSLLLAKVSANDGVLQVVVDWLKHASLSLGMIEAAIDGLDQHSLEAVLDVILGLIPADRRLWSRRILSFACAAERPLGVTELYTVSWIARTLPDDPSVPAPRLAVVKMAYFKDERRGILDWLGGLLTIRDGEVHLSHPSIRDALRPQNSSHILGQHKDILDVCMAHLGMPRGVSLRDSPPDQRDWDNDSFGSAGVLDSLPYAMEHWSRHYLLLSDSCSTNNLREQASQLLKKESFMIHWAVTQQARGGKRITQAGAHPSSARRPFPFGQRQALTPHGLKEVGAHGRKEEPTSLEPDHSLRFQKEPLRPVHFR
ncbi:hypothetical protein IMZ48_39045, partial [Candidatus Bathyarchaeota archaeon]|nr:hypothetical protein [Candidatus Bathyarchaeota archaeon]